jgi:hypothetical protein
MVNSHLAFRLQNALTGAASPELQVRLEAERELVALREEYCYPVLVFSFLQGEATSPELRLRGAIEFKLWCRRYSTLEAYQAQDLQKPVAEVKAHLLAYYVGCEGKVAAQLQQAIKHLAARDYFKNWESLPKELMALAG